MPTVNDSAERIEQLIKYHDAAFQRVFYQAIATIRDTYTLEELVRLLEANNYEAALRTIERGAALLGNQYGNSLAHSAQATATWLATAALDINILFDPVNARAVERMQLNRLRLVQNFTQEQRQMLRGVLSNAIADGLNPRAQAILFRDSIGLTAVQEQHVRNYARELRQVGYSNGLNYSNATRRELRSRRYDRSLARAIRNEQPLTEAQIKAMVDKYRSNYIAYRARTIARTESLRAVHEGAETLYLQAIDEGVLDEDSIVRTWITAQDERVRSTHALLHGQKKKIGEYWVTENGRLRHPGDPAAPAIETIQCRCVLTYTLKN